MSAPDPGTPVLEDAAQAFAEATAKPPFLFDLPVAEGRATVDTAQDGSFPDPAARVEELTIDGGPTGTVHLTIYRPAGSVGVLPVVLYTHGAGWVFGDVHTHDRLVRELTTRAEAATVFTSYSLSPEARYPTAIEQIYAALEWIAGSGGEHDLDGGRIMRAPRTWPACRRPWSSTARPTCCATRARPTPPACARPGSRSPRSATTARSTTSSC
jgi:acetyl esterase